MPEPQRTFGDLLAEAVRLAREGAPGVGRRLRGEFERAGLMGSPRRGGDAPSDDTG